MADAGASVLDLSLVHSIIVEFGDTGRGRCGACRRYLLGWLPRPLTGRLRFMVQNGVVWVTGLLAVHSLDACGGELAGETRATATAGGGNGGMPASGGLSAGGTLANPAGCPPSAEPSDWLCGDVGFVCTYRGPFRTAPGI